MRLHWEKDPNSMNRYIAETPRYRFVMIAPRRGKPELWVQHAGDDWGQKPIDQRACRSRRNAERIAQRFEDSRYALRRLRLQVAPLALLSALRIYFIHVYDERTTIWASLLPVGRRQLVHASSLRPLGIHEHHVRDWLASLKTPGTWTHVPSTRRSWRE